MIDRVEVVRGGGSSLYGGNAIGGVINIITKRPMESNFTGSYLHSFINGNIPDRAFQLSGSSITAKQDAGVFYSAITEKEIPGMLMVTVSLSHHTLMPTHSEQEHFTSQMPSLSYHWISIQLASIVEVVTKLSAQPTKY
ncbi:hypothetical protein MASR1M45_13170 [Candidatus Kapaibacterium sp.]